MDMKKKIFPIFLIVHLIVLTALGQEPSKWRGPNENGIYDETGLLKQWPASGPALRPRRMRCCDRLHKAPPLAPDRTRPRPGTGLWSVPCVESFAVVPKSAGQSCPLSQPRSLVASPPGCISPAGMHCGRKGAPRQWRTESPKVTVAGFPWDLKGSP